MHILVSFIVLPSASSWFSFSLGRLSTAWTVFSSLSTSWTNSEVRLSSIRVMFWVTFVGRKNMALIPSVRGSWAICKDRNKREIRKGHINNKVLPILYQAVAWFSGWNLNLSSDHLIFFPVCFYLTWCFLTPLAFPPGFYPSLLHSSCYGSALSPAALLWGILTWTPLNSCSKERLVERGRDGKVSRGVPCPSCPTLSQAIQAGRTWA